VCVWFVELCDWTLTCTRPVGDLGYGSAWSRCSVVVVDIVHANEDTTRVMVRKLVSMCRR